MYPWIQGDYIHIQWSELKIIKVPASSLSLGYLISIFYIALTDMVLKLYATVS